MFHRISYRFFDQLRGDIPPSQARDESENRWSLLSIIQRGSQLLSKDTAHPRRKIPVNDSDLLCSLDGIVNLFRWKGTKSFDLNSGDGHPLLIHLFDNHPGGTGHGPGGHK